MPNTGCTTDEESVAASTSADAVAYDQPRAAMR